MTGILGCLIMEIKKNNDENNNQLKSNTEKTIQNLKSTNHELEALNITISHEIKAPVRAIDGYARIFIEDYGSGVDEDGLVLLQNIRNICKDTLILINSLLDYTKFADAEPISETIDLKAMLWDVFHNLSISYSEKQKIQIKIDEHIPYILADSLLIRQVLVNLLSNALKFTKNKEISIITVGYYLSQNEHVFFVKDNGVGFDMEFSSNLFGMFQRMHTIDDYEGSGVGLAIVRKIIQKFGGRVWITGEVGKGACVYFTIAPEHILK